METSVNDIGVAVITALRSAGPMESTIGQYQKSIKWLDALATENCGIYSCDLGAHFALLTTSPRAGKFSQQRCTDYQRLIHLYDSYVLTGCVDLSVRKRPATFPYPDSPEFSKLLISWDQAMKQRELSEVTLYSFGSWPCST